MTKEVGRYEILMEIGQGGFAIVYRGRDRELEREVALKELKPVLLQDTNWVKRFRREARTIARLDHPRIVTIHDVYEAEERLFIVMRLVDGFSLEEVIASRGRLSLAETIEIITAVAEGLDYAHSQDILHRDLKPANILIDSERGPMLTDFGLAKLAGEHSLSVSALGSVVGTPHYIAPELWEGQEATPQSDIYALGCILYEMLTGEKIFKGETPPAVMMAHFKPLKLPEVWPEDVPADIATVLDTALAKKPVARYATAEEMVKELAALIETEPEPKPAESAHLPVTTASEETVTLLPPADQKPEDREQAEPESQVLESQATGTKPERTAESIFGETEAERVKRLAGEWKDIITRQLTPSVQKGVKQVLTSAEQATQQWQERLPPETGPAASPQPVTEEGQPAEQPPVHPPPPTASGVSQPPSGLTPVVAPVYAKREKKRESGCLTALKNLVVACLILIGVGTVCLWVTGLSEPEDITVKVGPTITNDFSISRPDTAETPYLKVDLASAELFISPGLTKTLVNGFVNYNVDRLHPQVITNGRSIRFGPERNIGLASRLKGNIINEWRLELGSAPMELNLNTELTQANLELGGLSLTDLNIYERAALEFDLSFSKPNQTKMDTLGFKGIGSFATLTGLANTHAEDINFNSSGGVYTLDFSGELPEDMKVRVDSWLSWVTIIVPEGVPTELSIDNRPTNIDVIGAWEETETGYILPGEGPKIKIDIDMGSSNLKLRNR